MGERRGSVYDPARDTFEAKTNDAASDNAIEDDEDIMPGHASPLKRKRDGNKDEPTPSAKLASSSNASSDQPTASNKAITMKSLSGLTRVKKDPLHAGDNNKRRRSRSPTARSGDRSPRNMNSTDNGSRRSRSRSPPRQRKRPGAGARVNRDTVEEVRRRQEEREKQQSEATRQEMQRRGVADVVTQHYNAVPQRGRQWRQTDSKIKGLRSFNNWIKSAVIQKFSPDEDWASEGSLSGQPRRSLKIIDMGCGKGGDLQKWNAAPQRVGLYYGLDPAAVSITQARERYREMLQRDSDRHGRTKPNRVFDAHFWVKDCFGTWLGDIDAIRSGGIDPTVGPDGNNGGQPRQGGFDVVSMMFCMHYAFESEQKCRGMLKNAAGVLRRGGRLIGVCPNSDVIKHHVLKAAGAISEAKTAEDDDWDPEKPAASVMEANTRPDEQRDDDWDPERPAEQVREPPKEEMLEGPIEWGNDIYKVRFPGAVPKSGVFKPEWSWEYFYFLEEAVEEVPEYVVPWEGFRYLASQYNLELQYRRPFNEIWESEKHDRILGPLSERMGVKGRNGNLQMSAEEMEAVSFYHAFCFVKT